MKDCDLKSCNKLTTDVALPVTSDQASITTGEESRL